MRAGDLYGQGVRVTWVNHSSILVQMAGFTFLTDPIWSERYGGLRWLAWLGCIYVCVYGWMDGWTLALIGCFGLFMYHQPPPPFSLPPPYPPFPSAAPPSSSPAPAGPSPPYALAELPPVDFVLLSHNHYDHLDIGGWVRGITFYFCSLLLCFYT